MNLFEEISLRLKQQLGVPTDKDASELLGIAPTAWANRKKRDAFPTAELHALAAMRPELALDVPYVLTGKRSQANVSAKLSTAGDRVRLVRGMRHTNDFAKSLGVDAAYLEQVESAGQWMSNELLTSIVEHENISPMWLMSGELPVLAGELSPMEVSLIDCYRHSGITQQAALRGHAATLRAQTIAANPPAPKITEAIANQGPTKKQHNSAKVGDQKQVASGPGSNIQVGGSVKSSTVFNGGLDGDSEARGKRAAPTSGARRKRG